jgi:hypothetical protein
LYVHGTKFIEYKKKEFLCPREFLSIVIKLKYVIIFFFIQKNFIAK